MVVLASLILMTLSGFLITQKRINQKIQKTKKEKEATALNSILSSIQRLPFSLREKRPNTEFFLVRIFLYFDRIQENTDQKKLSIWALFTQCLGK